MDNYTITTIYNAQRGRIEIKVQINRAAVSFWRPEMRRDFEVWNIKDRRNSWKSAMRAAHAYVMGLSAALSEAGHTVFCVDEPVALDDLIGANGELV